MVAIGDDRMKIAIVCNTPYQLMCTLNYAYHTKKEKSAGIDLYLGNNFAGFDKAYSRLQKLDLFENIYVFQPRLRGKTLWGNVDRFLNIVSPKRCLNSFLKEPNVFLNKKYDLILASVASYFVVALILLCPGAEVQYYDDGSGSYARELSVCLLSPLAVRTNRLLGRDINRIIPTKILLNCPELASEEVKAKAQPLPPLWEAPAELRDLLHDLWNYHDDGYYRSKKLICLLSPNDDALSGLDRFQSDIQKRVPDICENYIARLHPRQKPEEYAGCKLDSHGDMWELVCASQITDEHVLLADLSTAQMTPKMLYDVEPVLIFSYRAYPEGYWASFVQRREEIVERLKASYRHKDRILVPETPEELWECVKEHCKNT